VTSVIWWTQRWCSLKEVGWDDYRNGRWRASRVVLVSDRVKGVQRRGNCGVLDLIERDGDVEPFR
jgi:hypothetical protein